MVKAICAEPIVVKEHFLEGVALIGLDKAYKKRFREAEKKRSAPA